MTPSGQRSRSRISRQRSSVPNISCSSRIVIGEPQGMEKGKREQLKRVPMRKLVASVKKDIRRIVRGAPNLGQNCGRCCYHTSRSSRTPSTLTAWKVVRTNEQPCSCSCSCCYGTEVSKHVRYIW